VTRRELTRTTHLRGLFKYRAHIISYKRATACHKSSTDDGCLAHNQLASFRAAAQAVPLARLSPAYWGYHGTRRQ